jgi:hypothetical protein
MKIQNGAFAGAAIGVLMLAGLMAEGQVEKTSRKRAENVPRAGSGAAPAGPIEVQHPVQKVLVIFDFVSKAWGAEEMPRQEAPVWEVRGCQGIELRRQYRISVRRISAGYDYCGPHPWLRVPPDSLGPK